jgi:hypothetical protein
LCHHCMGVCCLDFTQTFRFYLLITTRTAFFDGRM